MTMHDEASPSAEPFTPHTDDLVIANAAFADEFRDTDLAVFPQRNLAIVTCMDSRMDTFKMLGLGNGEAHIIRNAGGVITDDVIRSLCLSQRYLKTREIVLIHHTDCGLQRVSEDAFNAELQDELGIKPGWSLESFTDPYADVRQSLQRVLISPFIKHKDWLRGFVYEVTTGRLVEVHASDTD